MTTEEAIKTIENAKHFAYDDVYNEAFNVAIKALETVEEFEKSQIITGGRLNGRSYAYKCGLEDGKRKALKQEPCEDAISRQAVDKLKSDIMSWINSNNRGNADYFIVDKIEELVKGFNPPSVQPKPKIGHWIVSTDCEGKTRQCTCNLCGYETGKYTWKNPNFCENCGAKMEGETE